LVTASEDLRNKIDTVYQHMKAKRG